MIDFSPIIKNILAVIGGLTIIITFFEVLFRIVPQFGNLKAKFWGYLARKWKYRRLEKLAIASDVENAVNEVVLDLRSELPAGWIGKATIDWVDKDIKIDDLKDEETILRIRPLENQDENLISGIYFFFAKYLFPAVKDIVPINVRKASALHISRRAIRDKKPFLTQKFESGILEASIKEDVSILGYIDKYEEIDAKGFFTGAFLREIHEIACRSKFKELRNKIEEEIKSVLKHIGEFAKNIYNRTNPDWKWSRKGPATSYAFLLVAQPFHGGTDPYVNRIREHLKQGVERIYIMGVNQEKGFVKRVVSDVSKIPQCRLVEVFDLNRDYRGDRKGICALFEKGTFEGEAENKIESFFDNVPKEGE